jgi:hypothetical protein
MRAFIIKALLVLFWTTMFPGCATVDRQSRVPLVGNWIYADQAQSCRYTFNVDGSFRGEVKLNGATTSRFTGRWTVKEKALLYTYLSDAFGRIPVGATDRDEILEISEDSFLIRAANGERRRYRRLP